MTHEQFKKIENALSKYFEEAKSCGHDALRNKFAVLKANLATNYEDAREIAYLYRLYRMKKYPLKRLVYYIILLRYKEETFENALGDKMKVKSLTVSKSKKAKIRAFIKFMSK